MRRFRVGWRLFVVVAVTPLVYVLIQYPVRRWETITTANILRNLGFRGLPTVLDTSILVVPYHHASFWVTLTPSCSALAPALAVTCLASMMPRATSRRFLAIGAAVVAVVVGNFVRISSSVVVGLYAGRSSLVLFHDWVGSMIGFAFTLGGFVLMLWILIPARGPAPVPSVVTGGAD